MTHTRGLPYAIEVRTDTTPTAEAVAEIKTAGDMQRWLVRYFRSGSQLSTFTDGTRSDEEIWLRLRRVVAEHFGVSVEAVREETFLSGE